MSNIVKSEKARAYHAAAVFDLADIEAKAASIITAANKQSAAALAAARKEAVDIRKRAADDGRAEGIETGRAQGVELGSAEGREAAFAEASEGFSAAAASLASACADLASRKDNLFLQAETDLLKLSILIARKVVAREIEADKYISADNLKRCLSLLSEKRNLVARVAPSALDAVNERLPEIAAQTGDLSSVKVVADDSIAPGGCLVTGAAGLIDATIESQFGEIERILFGEQHA